MLNDLIYDIGMHVGEDTEFYLKKGFRVVAIEADPEHAANGARKFAKEISEGRLTIVNKAIAAKAGPVSFYRSKHNTAWGTIYPKWAERNTRLGDRTAELIEIEATTIDAVYAEYGIPYFMKIDIEGADILCLEALRTQPSKPRYVSLESGKTAFGEIRTELKLMRELGYGKFKVVPQHFVPDQIAPRPALEGQFADHTFVIGASGLFGEEAPGEWLDEKATLKAYRPIFLRYLLVGDNPISRFGKRVFARLGVRDGWYDTHAKLTQAT